jgi:hypothetical protein
MALVAEQVLINSFVRMQANFSIDWMVIIPKSAMGL